MSDLPVTIEVPEAFVNRFMNTHEKAFDTTLSTQEIEVKLKKYILDAFILSVTRWAMEHGTI